MRRFLSSNGKCLCLVIHCGNDAFEGSSSYLAPRRRRCCRGRIRICGSSGVRGRRFFSCGLGRKLEENDGSREKRGYYYEIILCHVSIKLSTYNVDAARRCIL